MNDKYEFTNEIKLVAGHRLHRIRALHEIATHTKTGELGGWIESEKNPSTTGDAWVSGEAQGRQRKYLAMLWSSVPRELQAVPESQATQGRAMRLGSLTTLGYPKTHWCLGKLGCRAPQGSATTPGWAITRGFHAKSRFQGMRYRAGCLMTYRTPLVQRGID